MSPVHRHDFRDELEREKASHDREFRNGLLAGVVISVVVAALAVLFSLALRKNFPAIPAGQQNQQTK